MARRRPPALALAPLPLLLASLWLLLLLALQPPPAVAAQQSQQQPQPTAGAAGVEAWYRFPLCLQSATGQGCLDASAAAAASPDSLFGGFSGGGGGGGGSRALSAPGAGAVLSVAWDPAREGYILWRQKAMTGADPPGVLLANATAVEGAM